MTTATVMSMLYECVACCCCWTTTNQPLVVLVRHLEGRTVWVGGWRGVTMKLPNAKFTRLLLLSLLPPDVLSGCARVFRFCFVDCFYCCFVVVRRWMEHTDRHPAPPRHACRAAAMVTAGRLTGNMLFPPCTSHCPNYSKTGDDVIA